MKMVKKHAHHHLITHPSVRYTDEHTKGKIVVCGSTVFAWDDWGGDHWFLAQ